MPKATLTAPRPSEIEERDDSETVSLLDSEFRTDSIGNSNFEMRDQDDDDFDEPSSDSGTGDSDDINNNIDLNVSVFHGDDDCKLDINSVLSGNVNDDEFNEDDQDNDDQHVEVFGKNLGAIFDDNANERKDSMSVNPDDDSGDKSVPAAKPANINSNKPSRPPLAPGRPASATAKAPPLLANDGNQKRPATAPSSNTKAVVKDSRLLVYLRVRPPVCSKGKKDNEGSVNTIEVIKDTTTTVSTMPTTIRTYPPLNSNAAKVVRGGNKLAMMSGSQALSKKNSMLSSKSLADDESSESGLVDSRAEVRGVKEYSYSGVFGPNSSQSDVYDVVAAPLVDGLFPQNINNLDADDVSSSLGESALLFTLGVTNAGKTHTVMGTGFETKSDIKTMMQKMIDHTPNKDWGIIPRALNHMLNRVNSLNSNCTSGPKLQMYMSYLEIYNEQIYDLLPGKSEVPRRPCDGQPTLKLRESRRGRIFVRGLAKHAVNNVQQGLELAQMAKNNRHTASNNINANSSRSHSVCQLEIAHLPSEQGAAVNTIKPDPPDVGADSECETDDESVCSRSSNQSQGINKQRKSTIIWIVDLAGSERSKKTRSHSVHQKEAALINASLMNLMRCLREMLNNQPRKRGVAPKGGVVPFRESKLTHMFMNHLTGPAASRTCMIVNVNPAADDYDETQHVLGYAATARNVTISAIDYNRKRRLLAEESKVKLTMSPKKVIANIVKKISPKKRKESAVDSSSIQQSKRLRSGSHVGAAAPNHSHTTTTTTSLNNGQKFARAAWKPPSGAVKDAVHSENADLNNLREENFNLKLIVDDLRRQLFDGENEVREEVVEAMSEQLQESKEWYESRILQLREQIDSLQSSKQASMHPNSNEADLLERIDECEEEMKRMREEHDIVVEDLNAAHLQLNNEHEEAIANLTKEFQSELRNEQTKCKRLEAEIGALRHQSRELQVSHDNLLAKYNELLDSLPHEKENPSTNMAESPFRKLPRDRASDVASTADCGDINSPKKKRGWFTKSPAKVAAGSATKRSPAEPLSSNRSPLGKINKK
ncbi:hypothetical protein ACHAWU_004748 [Discostella pseudostelligera]|uniref:Kinesin motor domain-containing protein n=1 Tax=Discostella pseudostelligera TaxID=259834 RepID=A0ABD3MNW8_9STRA